ncbi:hypothetical protein IJ541_03610 [bacterium]|nr:hypothetical protein [bacterium]
MKNKLLLSSIMLCLSALPISAQTTLSEISHPKDPAYRVGISETPENQYIQAEQSKIKPETKYAHIDNSQDSSIADMTYADLTIKRLSKEISQELEFEQQEMLTDLSLLWQGAAMQSDTINFALYKLANPDADKPDEKSIKKVLSTIASMSTLVGASIGSPVIAGSSLIGGNILGIMSQDTKALNYKYTRVNDADMIILIRKVEDLQQKAVDLYYDYMSAKKQLEFANELVTERQNKFELAQQNNAPRELIVITDAYYRTALDRQRTAKSEFYAKRAALEQFVGNETFTQFETELAEREKSDNGENNLTIAQNNQEEYSNTIQTVTEYTNNLEQMETTVNEANPYLYQDMETITGSSSNIENNEELLDNDEENLTSKKGKSKKSKKIKTKKESNKTTAETPKYPKNSTKNLIFLHGQDKHSVQKPNSQTTQNVSDKTLPSNNSVQNIPTYTPKSINEFGLPPLDEIRIPDLKQGGYSIHSDFTQDINSGNTTIFEY